MVAQEATVRASLEMSGALSAAVLERHSSVCHRHAGASRCSEHTPWVKAAPRSKRMVKRATAAVCDGRASRGPFSAHEVKHLCHPAVRASACSQVLAQNTYIVRPIPRSCRPSLLYDIRRAHKSAFTAVRVHMRGIRLTRCGAIGLRVAMSASNSAFSERNSSGRSGGRSGSCRSVTSSAGARRGRRVRRGSAACSCLYTRIHSAIRDWMSISISSSNTSLSSLRRFARSFSRASTNDSRVTLEQFARYSSIGLSVFMSRPPFTRPSRVRRPWVKAYPIYHYSQQLIVRYHSGAERKGWPAMWPSRRAWCQEGPSRMQLTFHRVKRIDCDALRGRGGFSRTGSADRF